MKNFWIAYFGIISALPLSASEKAHYQQRVIINQQWGLVATVVKIDKRAPIRFKLKDIAKRIQNDSALSYWDKNRHDIIVNGGYFDQQFAPVGYYKVNSKVVNPHLSKNLSGLIGISRHGKLSLLTQKDFSQTTDLPTVIQSGPFLIDPDGKPGIHKNNYKRYQRTVIAKTYSGDTLIISTAPISLYNLSKGLMAEIPDVERALNLDGGPSSALITDKITLQNRMPVRSYLIGYSFKTKAEASLSD